MGGVWPTPFTQNDGIRSMEKFYSLKTAAEMLNTSIRTLRRIIKTEDIEVYKVGSRLRLSESQVKSMIKPQKSAKTIVDELLSDLSTEGVWLRYGR